MARNSVTPVMPAGVDKLDGLGAIVALHGHGSEPLAVLLKTTATNAARCVTCPQVSPGRHCARLPRQDFVDGPAAEADVMQIIDEYRKVHKPERVIDGWRLDGAASD